MLRQLKFAMIGATLAFVSACAVQPKTPPATASDTSRTSLCLIIQLIPIAFAPGEGVDDPGNKFDTDATAERIMEQNGKLRAACPAP